MSYEKVMIAVPKEYGYVILSLVSTFAVSQWLAIRVVPYRLAAGIMPPHAYASPEQIAAAAAEEKGSSDSSSDKSPSSSSSSSRDPSKPSKQEAMHLFNCAQRGQANFVENHSSFVGAMLIAGTKYPVATAVTGAVWSVSRVLFALGYTKRGVKDGKGRVVGQGAFVANLVLVGMAAWVGWGMLAEGV